MKNNLSFRETQKRTFVPHFIYPNVWEEIPTLSLFHEISFFTSFILGVASAFLIPISAEAEKSRPNILILYGDGLGFGDLTSYNADSKIPTPHLDQLAAEHPERVAELQNLLKQSRGQGYSAPRLAK